MKRFFASILTICLLLPHFSVFAAGTQKAMFIMDEVKITQLPYDGYSHSKQNAIDIVSENGKGYAPFDGHIIRIVESYNAIWFKSDNKVKYANGIEDYMTVVLMHDNQLNNLKLNQHIKQGEYFYDVGVKSPESNITGAHIHLECIRGNVNTTGAWTRGNVYPYDALFLNCTTKQTKLKNTNWLVKDCEYCTTTIDGKKVVGVCRQCHSKYDYSKIYTGDVAGLWIAKKSQNINLYNEPYEDASYTSVKSGELEVRGYVNNAYGNKWYVINGDKNKTYYVYENTFKNLYTQDSHYYENDYHRYDSGAVIEAPNTNNNGGNNTGIGNSIVGVVDIPSSWDNLSIRTGPSTNYQIVGSMNDGVRCNVYPSKTQNGWYYVEYNGIYGYASGKQINTSNTSITTTPSTPAGISLSTSNVNLDYPNSVSQTITVTATGDLPSKYTFELNLSGNINFNWGSSWSGNSINLSLSANQNSNSTTGTIYLKDSNSNGVLASINFNVNVTKPIVKEYITVYFDTTGSSTSFASQTVEKYGTVTTPYREPNRTGYTFLGWSSNLGVTIGQYSANETISVGENDLVLYAIWQKDKADWSEWDLSLSKYDLYFEDHDKEKTVIIKVDKQDDSEFYFTLEFDENIDITLGDEYYNEHGIFCTEVIVSTPQKSLSNEKVTIRMRDENHEIVDSTSFYVYREEETELFPDRNPSGISVYLNGKKLSFDVQPQIINSRTMVPMRKIFEELGTVVGWNNNTQRAISVKKGDVVSVSIGGQYLTVNGEQKLLDSPPVIISGRTLVPVRAVAESFNCDVEWYDYGASQVVDINMKDTINSMENIGSLLIGYSEFPPFSYYDDYGNLIGFDTELAKYVCDFWGWDCSFVEIPFDMKFVAINSGQIDCYWNGVTKTEERAEICTFSNEYVSFDMEYEEDGEWYTSHEVYSVPFRKGDYDTVQLVNIALEEAQKDGTIEYLKYKYGIE